jgi:hypothetical protein
VRQRYPSGLEAGYGLLHADPVNPLNECDAEASAIVLNIAQKAGERGIVTFKVGAPAKVAA